MRIFFILNVAVIYSEGWEITPPDPVLLQANEMVDFIYYPYKIPWIAARRVCQSLGGDLAKIDSEELLADILRIADENYGNTIFTEEYWVGLVELADDNYFWVSDCSNLTYTSKYTGTFDDTKLCFRLKHSDPYQGERKKCTESNAFMCQILSGIPCIMTGRLNGEVLTVGTNMSSCQSKCSRDARCWGSVDYIPDNCVTLALPGYGEQSLNFATKSCHNVMLNMTTIDPDNTGSSETPDATCSSIVTPAAINNTGILIEPSACVPFNITQNVTVTTTQLTVVTSNLTIIEQPTIISTQPFTTISVSMSTTTMTSVITEYVYINSTVNVTLEQAEEIAQEIVKNLTIDSKSTSSHIRRLTSATDKRQSSIFIGCVAALIFVIPFVLMLVSDVHKTVSFWKQSESYKL